MGGGGLVGGFNLGEMGGFNTGVSRPTQTRVVSRPIVRQQQGNPFGLNSGGISSPVRAIPRATAPKKSVRPINPSSNPFGLNFGGVGNPVSSPVVRKKKISADPLGLRGFY